MNKTTRYIFRCKNCNHVESRDIASNFVRINGKDTMIQDIRCPQCNRRFGKIDSVKGQYSAAHVCGPKCLNAVGPSCDCQCGGENHGAGHLVA